MGWLTHEEQVSAKLAALKLREDLEYYLKRHSPLDYLPKAAWLLRKIIGKPDQMAMWPPHFLLHSMEASCAYARKGRNAPVTIDAINRIVRVYKDYPDLPVLRQLECASEVGDLDQVELVFMSMAREQFAVQGQEGRYDFARGVKLFLDGQLPAVEKEFTADFGFGFDQWFMTCLAMYAAARKATSPVITISSLLDLQLLRPPATKAAFELISLSVDGVREAFFNLRQGRNPWIELHVPCVFVERPLVRLSDDSHLVTHLGFLLSRTVTGLYDICRERYPVPFGSEFGTAFQCYVGDIITQFPGNPIVLTEAELRRRLGGKVCDYLVATDREVLLVECKAVQYSSVFVTERAVSTANSTDKVAVGMEQLCNVAAKVREGALADVVGDLGDRHIVGLVVTYRHLWFANGEFYWKSLSSKVALPPGIEFVDAPFTCRPQVLDASEFERLVMVVRTGERVSGVIGDKLSKSQWQVGEWETYLNERLRGSVETLPLLERTYRSFWDGLYARLKS